MTLPNSSDNRVYMDGAESNLLRLLPNRKLPRNSHTVGKLKMIGFT